MRTTKTQATWVISFLLLAVAIILLSLSLAQANSRDVFLVICFLPFPWFIRHFIAWLMLRSHFDEAAVLQGNLVALEKERHLHRSQIIASTGALYFLVVFATWVFINAL